MTNFDTVSANLESAINSINDLHASLISRLDNSKNTLLSLLDDIAMTKNDLATLGKLCGNAGTALLNIGSDCSVVCGHVNDVLLSCDDIPLGSIGTFVSYCADCGAELHVGDTYMDDGDGDLHCMDCVDAFAKAENTNA